VLKITKLHSVNSLHYYFTFFKLEIAILRFVLRKTVVGAGDPSLTLGMTACWMSVRGVKNWRFDHQLFCKHASSNHHFFTPPCNHLIDMSFRAERGISRNHSLIPVKTLQQPFKGISRNQKIGIIFHFF
jgi:hypothetical protein